jgi:hypothetical protein
MVAFNEYYQADDASDDQVFIAKCPDLETGTNGDEPVTVYPALGEVVQQAIDHLRRNGGKLPARKNGR